MDGQLWPRHFMPVLPINSILVASALVSISKLEIVKKFIIKKHVINFLIVIAFLITIFGIFYKKTFWERDTTSFYKFGQKVSSIVPDHSKIMYGLTVQDLWCVSKKEKLLWILLLDKQKIQIGLRKNYDFYKIDYLVIDLSNHIYKRDHENLDAMC